MLWIDTYNVLHTRIPNPAGAPALPRTVDALVERIARSRFARRGAVLVCDGAGPAPGRRSHHYLIDRDRADIGDVRIIYAGSGVEADARLEAMIADIPPKGGGEEVLVVSSDRRIIRAATRKLLGTLSASEFLAALLDDARSHHRRQSPSNRPAFAEDVPLDRHAITLWADRLGVDALELSLLVQQASAALDALRHLAPSAGPTPHLPFPPATDRPSKQASRRGRSTRSLATNVPTTPPSPSAALPDDTLRQLLHDCGVSLPIEHLDMNHWLAAGHLAPPASKSGRKSRPRKLD